MAAKYWYVANNGNADWNVAANWYLGSGGTGGTTTVPSASDTVYLNAASGSGTITITAAAACNSLICTGFSGTLAGASSLTITDTTISVSVLLNLSSTMSITYSGLLTIAGSGVGQDIYFNGKTLPGSVTLSKSASTGSTYYYFKDTVRITGLLTISSGFAWIQTGALYVGQFSMSGTSSSTNRDISGGTIYLTGSGNVLTVSTTGTFSNNLLYELTDTTSNSKTLTSTVSIASGFEPYINITGGGTGSYLLTGTFGNINVNTTNSVTPPIFAFSIASSIYTLKFNNSYVNWNNPSIALTIYQDILYLSPNMVVTATPTITMNSNITLTSNGKQFTNPITVTLGSTLNTTDAFRLANTLTLTNGSLSASNDVYVNSISSSSSNFRDISIVGYLYLTGTGILVTTTTTTNLTVSIPRIYISDTSGTGLNKSLTFNTIFGSPIVYIAGTGAGLISFTPGNTIIPSVYVTNTGGSLTFVTGTINNLEFISGTTCTWANTGGVTLTIVKDLKLTSTQSSPTLTPAITFQNVNNITSAGKSLVTGAVIIASNEEVTINDDFSTNSTITFANSVNAYCAGNITCTTLTITNSTASSVVNFQKNITATSISITGGRSVTIGNINNTSITVTCTSISLTNSSLLSVNSSIVNCSGAFSSAAGKINFIDSSLSFLTFALSGATSTYSTTNSKIYITGATTTAFSLVSTIASYTTFNSTIEFNNNSVTATTFAGGGLAYENVIFNRGSATGNNVVSGNNTFTNFRDLGTAAHNLLFTAASTQNIGNFVVNGSSGALITLNSTTTGIFTLNKSPLGIVNCDYLNIQHCVATPSTGTWYAGTNSVNNQAVATAGSGWIFTNMPPRKLGSGGVG